jgi:hypothetical protein
MKTDFASLYVRARTSGGALCDDYLFHWANGFEYRTDRPSKKPSNKPMSAPRAPSIKPSKRPASKPSLAPTVTPPKPTRAPLPLGQYYYSPTNELISGTNVCSVKVRYLTLACSQFCLLLIQ